MRHAFSRYRSIMVAVVLAVSSLLWLAGFSQSPVRNPRQITQRQFINRYIEQHAPDLHETRNLAEAYWKRYRDVSQNEYYGKNGKLGIYGAEEHFKYHGRREGRVFGPIPLPEDPRREPALAEAYWQRYPDIENSEVWGRRSTLGILGPRDHFHYRGKKQGRAWGPAVSERDD